MKTLKSILLVMAFGFMVSCNNNPNPEIKTVDNATTESNKKELDPNAHYAKAEFGISGMTCEMGCAKTIEKKIAKMEGVKSAKVDFDKELAMVEYDDAKVDENALEAAVKATGEAYSVKDMKTVDQFSDLN